MRFQHDRGGAYRPLLTLAFRASPYDPTLITEIFSGECTAASQEEPVRDCALSWVPFLKVP